MDLRGNPSLRWSFDTHVVLFFFFFFFVHPPLVHIYFVDKRVLFDFRGIWRLGSKGNLHIMHLIEID